MFNKTTLLLILSFVAIFPIQKVNAIEIDAIEGTQNSLELSIIDSTVNADNTCDRGSERFGSSCYKSTAITTNTQPDCDRGSGRCNKNNNDKTKSQQFNKERGSGRINTEEETKKILHR